MYSTRFQGSKRRVLPWLLDMVDEVLPEPGRVLDAFAGSGVVSYGLVRRGHEVVAVDRLWSTATAVRAMCGGALPLPAEVVEEFRRLSQVRSDGWLVREFSGIHYPDDELHWLDNAAALAHRLPAEHRHVALWAICQSALAKRPYNLFHRANLAMRTRDVTRSFGNKVTWERPFPDHFARFVDECNSVMLGEGVAHPWTGDPRDVPHGGFDLLYLDPPYLSHRRVPTPYNDYYSFLDYLCEPATRGSIDHSRPHRPARCARSDWERPATLMRAVAELVDAHPTAAVLISYRGDGFPTPTAIADLLGERRPVVGVFEAPVKYALSRSGGSSECLVVSRRPS